MDVLEFIATADPMRTKQPIELQLHDIDLQTSREFEVFDFPTTRTFDVRRAISIAAAIVVIASLGIFLPKNFGPTTYDWNSPAISPAAATVNLAQLYAQETRIKPGETLWVVQRNSQFNTDGTLKQLNVTKSWLATNWASVSYLKALVIDGVEVPAAKQLWTETSRMSGSTPEDLNDYTIGYSPVWERTVPYENAQAMYRTLVEQSKTFNPSWQSGSDWIAAALESLIVSETAAPAQRVVAISVLNALIDEGVEAHKWVATSSGERMLWSRTMSSNTESEVQIIDPLLPGIAMAVTYQIDAAGTKSLIELFQLDGWAVVGGLDVEPADSDIVRASDLDPSKL
ncbi:MAG: hypothetical protein RIS75_863 [Actinomycetota bacterium]